MALTDTTNPQIGGMTIRVTSGSSAAEFDRFLSYEYAEEYLSPSDSSSFDIAERELSATDSGVLVPGAKVQVVVDGLVQSTGILDDVAADYDRGSGSVVRVAVRDRLSMAVDAQVDPLTQFLPNMSLLDLLTTTYTQFGFSQFLVDNITNRNVLTGRIYGNRTTKKGKPLKSYTLGAEKPYPNGEGAFAFTSRICQRFGLWIRVAADGGTLIVAAPDFDQEPRYGLQHVIEGPSTASNNVEKGHFKRSRMEQPSIIYASGAGGGGNFAKSHLRSGIVNPIVGADNSKIIDRYPEVRLAALPPITAAFTPFVEGNPRPAFLYDSESHTQDQLDAYLRRELSLRMRKALTARYEFMGHKLNGQVVAVDTIVNVNDQRPSVKWQGPLWVLGRRFSKSASSGTRTVVELILPGSLVF